MGYSGPVMVPLLSLLLPLAGASQVSAPDPAEADAAFSAAILSELQEVDAEAADILRRADAARAQGDLSQAGALYAELVERAPALDHAWRRHCTVLQEAGLRDEALPRCQQALALADRPENQVALAYVLLDVPSGAAATPADRTRAGALLASARAQAPDDPMSARLRCHLATELDDVDLLAACVADLERVAPDHVMTGFHSWDLAFRQGRWADALAALERAEAAGMPAADAESFRQLTRDARPWWTVWVPALGAGALMGGLSLLIGRRLRRTATGPGSELE